MNQNVLKVLVPIIAVIVLVESVLLLTGLQKLPGQKSGEAPVQNNEEVADRTPSKPVNLGPAIYNVQIVADKTDISKSQTSTVTVAMKGDSDRSLDSVSFYVKYDQSAFDVTGLTFDKKLPKPAFSKVSTLKSLVVANFLISDPSGLKLKKDEILRVMTFQIKPKKTGSFNFEISTGDEMKESATMIVENATSKVLPYSSNILTVNVK